MAGICLLTFALFVIFGLVLLRWEKTVRLGTILINVSYPWR